MTALNFPDSPSNGDTYQGYTYNGTKGTWAKPAEQDARTAVYANIAALPTSGTAGDMAYVTATNRLYIWTGTGWYNIALINNNPTISGVSATYALAIDGTATTVTITATDPEGLPITYSIASDTSGNIATVAQGTGANTNVFTITPSTNTAHAGTFSLTFRASDGVNIASAAASFTLQFKVQNQKYTTALITSVGANNATNKSFTDSSSNTLTVTGYNQAHNTTFSPFRHGGYSVKFDGSGDNLGFASLSALNVDTYMSLECWVKLDANGSYLIVGRDAGYWLMYNQTGLGGASNKFAFGTYAGGSWQAVSSTTSPDIGVWYHVVGVRDNASFKIYVNGTLENTATISGSPSSGGVVGIGANTNQLGGSLNGYLADVRVVISANSSSLPYTSNFTPSTDRLTAITDTQLLACHLPYFKDGSTHNHAITRNGNVKLVGAGPHDMQEYASADHSSSLRFDQASNNDYVIVANDNSIMDLGSAFTLECWFWTENSNTDVAIMQRGGGGGAWNGTNGIYYGISFTSNKIAWISAPSSGNNQYMTGTTNIPLNQWNHVAVSYNGTTTSVYLNGNREVTSTQSYLIPTTRDVFAVGTGQVNGAASSTNDYTGNIAEFRLSNSVRYDPTQTTLTLPTAPFTSDSDTGILLKGGDAGIIDKAQAVKSVKLVGDTKSSTTQSKYLTSSMYFDGTDDYIGLNDQLGSAYGTGDFTIETWVYMTSAPSNYYYIWAQGSSTSGTNNFGVYYQSNVLKVWHNGGAAITGTNALSLNTWHHVALSREGTSLKLFLDGTQEGSTATNSSNITSSATGLTIARWIEIGDTGAWTGYISDLRITKGLARYTSNFTPPTAALQG